MSEDEDEELAMLRLQALMSKRRGGTGASKSLPFPPLTLPPVPAQPVPPPVASEIPATTIPAVVTVSAVVTSIPATETNPGTNNTDDSANTYRQPHFLRDQASYCNFCNKTGCSCNFSLFLEFCHNLQFIASCA